MNHKSIVLIQLCHEKIEFRSCVQLTESQSGSLIIRRSIKACGIGDNWISLCFCDSVSAAILSYLFMWAANKRIAILLL